jgi:hypothetical protein
VRSNPRVHRVKDFSVLSPKVSLRKCIDKGSGFEYFAQAAVLAEGEATTRPLGPKPCPG